MKKKLYINAFRLFSLLAIVTLFAVSYTHLCLLTNLLSSGYIIKRVIFFNFLGQHSLDTVQLGGGRIYLDAKQFRDFLMAFFLNDVQVEDCSVTIRQIPYHGMDDCWWNSLRVRSVSYTHLGHGRT